MKNRSMDLLKYEAFPELADAVRSVAGDVLDRWKAAVRSTLAPARELNDGQLHNDLPKILAMVADALEASDPRPTKALMDESGTHGNVRYDQNYGLTELMIEYSLLRQVLVLVVRERLSRELTSDEVTALNLAVDVAARRAVVMYSQEQRNELQAVAEAQTKYLSFLSHDLRGGLNGVLLMIEVLRKDLATEPRFAESLEDLDVMRRSILETVGTMDRFLHAERFRKGKVAVKPAEVDLRSLVQDVVGQYVYQARDKRLDLKPEHDGPILVTTDRELVGLILQNFVGNAVKYSKRGTIRVAACTDGLPDGVACRLSVIDQGPGIAPDRLSQLFAPFTRGETHGQPGTGLGLSIARQAAELLGAQLRAESKVGEGSSFHLDLPATPASDPLA